MILILSGEGPGDLGGMVTVAGPGGGPQFRPGPMAWIVDKLFESLFGYAPLSFPDRVQYIPEEELGREAMGRSRGRNVALTGKKRGKETGFFHVNAWALGTIAQRWTTQAESPVLAVLFRDCDGTRTQPNNWQAKWDSMMTGFARASFAHGVPMLPRPKSEAWLLCAFLQGASHQNCVGMEELSGNDDSPNSAKKKLAAALGGKSGTPDLLARLEQIGPDMKRLCQMPSFESFYIRLNEVLQSLRKRSIP